MNTSTTTPDDRPVPLARAAMPAGLWSASATFRHGQCDPAGIVYTPKFFDIFNQIIERWFCERLDLDYYDVIGVRHIGLGYANAAATFFQPCKMGEQIEVFVRVARIGSKSYTLVLHAMKGDAEALRGTFTTVVTSLDTMGAIAIPDDVRAALGAYAEQTGKINA